MSRFTLIIPLLLTLVPLAAATPPTAPGRAPQSALTPAQRDSAALQRQIEAHPDRAAAFAQLALAHARRARETHDPAFYEQAHAALDRSLELAPGNYLARRTRVWVLLGQHEFARALEQAQQLNREAPDDLIVYGLLVDANVELGRYDQAEEAAQWMLDLRPGNVPGITRAAYLRELFGDLAGAQELLVEACGRLDSSEVEERAWMLTHVAALQLQRGRPAEAESTLRAALDLFPGYHYALAGLGRVLTARGDFAGALAQYEARYRVAPHPECLFDLALALERAGRGAQAREAFARFEPAALAESANWDNANPELIRYYLELADRPADALKIARLEYERRRDVGTLTRYARALEAAGDAAAAALQIEAALAVGGADAEMQLHAGRIAAELGRQSQAAERYARALDSPFSEIRDAAEAGLVALAGSGDEDVD